MNYIKNFCGNQCSYLDVSSEELMDLENFLLPLGIQLRVVKSYGEGCIIDGRNIYGDCCIFAAGKVGTDIRNIAADEINELLKRKGNKSK